MILANPQIIGEGILVVTSELDQWLTPSGATPADRLDILGLGADGRLVVAELKRDRAPYVVEMQAVKYAALASRFTPEVLASQYARFLTQRGNPLSEEEARSRLQSHAGELDIEKLRTPRIVIIAGDFSDVLTSTVIGSMRWGLISRSPVCTHTKRRTRSLSR